MVSALNASFRGQFVCSERCVVCVHDGVGEGRIDVSPGVDASCFEHCVYGVNNVVMPFGAVGVGVFVADEAVVAEDVHWLAGALLLLSGSFAADHTSLRLTRTWCYWKEEAT